MNAVGVLPDCLPFDRFGTGESGKMAVLTLHAPCPPHIEEEMTTVPSEINAAAAKNGPTEKHTPMMHRRMHL